MKKEDLNLNKNLYEYKRNSQKIDMSKYSHIKRNKSHNFEVIPGISVNVMRVPDNNLFGNTNLEYVDKDDLPPEIQHIIEMIRRMGIGGFLGDMF